jgi:pimeloyl-ACP methyl ester carboxylesterase
MSGALIRATVARLYRTLAFAVPDAIEEAVVAAFTEHHSNRAAVSRYLETAHRLIPELRSPYRLDRITVPVLIVWGDRDRLVFHRGAEQILAAVAGARLELLPGIGHCPQVEAPERFTSLLLEFCGEADAIAA